MIARTFNKIKIFVTLDEIYIFSLLLAIFFVLIMFPGNN